MQGKLMQWAIGLADSYDVEMAMGMRQRLQYTLADRLVFRKIRALLGGNLVAILSGGAALSATTMNFFNALGIFCGQGYGMTETAPVIATAAPGAVRARSVGKPLQGVEVAIADDGEILTRGPHVMKGYYKLSEETAAVKADDGWLSTGDIGRLDEEGFLYITDRKKELFKLSTGKYVAPAPIEVALGGSPFIEHVVVVGNDCKFCSALVVPDIVGVRSQIDEIDGSWSDADVVAHEVVAGLIQREIDAVNAALPHWEQIKSFRLLATPFSIEGGELTPTLKIKRRVVYQKFQAEIEAIYA
jgi:long-chain acyl-CoA synthetase